MFLLSMDFSKLNFLFTGDHAPGFYIVYSLRVPMRPLKKTYGIPREKGQIILRKRELGRTRGRCGVFRGMTFAAKPKSAGPVFPEIARFWRTPSIA
jgi:hypothetical protein